MLLLQKQSGWARVGVRTEEVQRPFVDPAVLMFCPQVHFLSFLCVNSQVEFGTIKLEPQNGVLFSVDGT